MSEQIGDNSIPKDQIRSIVERIESIEATIKEHSDDRKDVYAEAKGNGYDVKALRAIIRRRAADAAKLAEQEAIVETYMHALGML